MKEYKIHGWYRGVIDITNILVGDSKSCQMTEGVNGDGSDEPMFEIGINKLVEIGIESGLWTKKENNLYEQEDSSDAWDKFNDRTEKYVSWPDEDDDF